jgi:PAS domain S-box-containing protein
MNGKDEMSEQGVDRALARQAMAEVFRDALEPALVVVVGALVIMAGCYGMRFAGGPWVWPTLAALGAAWLILLMRLALGGRTLSPWLAHLAAMGSMMICQGMLVTAMLTASGRLETPFVALLLVACGLLYLSWAWWAVTVVLIGGIWLAVVLGAPVMVFWDLHPYMLLAAAMLSAFALTVRRASLGRLVVSRLKEARNTQELKRLATALRESEARIRTIVEQQTEMVCRYRPDTTLTFVNASYARAFGREASELVGMRFLELAPPSERERIEAYLAGFTPTDNLRHNEYRMHISRGQTQVQLWTDRAFFDEEGRLVEFQSVGRDVTQQRAAELALRDSEARYRLLAENALDVITQHTLDGRYVYVSPSISALSGWSGRDLLGHSPYEWIHPDDQALVRERHLQSLHAPQPVLMTYRIRRSDGRWMWLETNVRRVEGGNGAEATLVAVSRDVNERMERERKLRETRDLLEWIITSSPAAIIALDEQAQVTLWNDAAQHIFGWEPREVMGKFMPTIPPWDLPAFWASFHAQMVNAQEGGDLVWPVRETRRLRKDGTLVDVEIAVGPIRDGDGTVVGTVGILTDITQRKRTELALQQSEEHYRRVAQTNQRLLAEVNHRVRNNLASLRSLLRLVGERATGVPQFAAAMEVRIAAMIQVHALLSEGNWQDVELRRLLEGLGRFTHDLTPHDNVISLAGPTVMLNPRQSLSLSMALAELYTNAVKYGCLSVPDGVLEVAWVLHEPDPGHTRPRLELLWRERGGPAITQPPGSSLGSELVEGFIRFELGGTCALRYPAQGAEHRLAFDLHPPAGAQPEAPGHRTVPRNVPHE